MILGIFIIIFGLVLLLRNLGLITLPISFWSLFSPLFLIVIGIYVIIAVKKGKEYWDQAIKKFIKGKKNHE
ncbi:MAG TPA: DUF5668 domain-containing protein [Syntrophales bacterium]|nr:DUF5668 domain-containing protein [Syntrophales bacterium]